MNRRPTRVHGVLRLDLLAGYFLLELQQPTLAEAPALLMGFESTLRSPLLKGRETELQNLRRACMGLTTHKALLGAARRHHEAHGAAHQAALLKIDTDTLRITNPFDLIPPALRKAIAALKQPHTPRAHGLQVAQPSETARLFIEHDTGRERRRYPLQGLLSTWPPPAVHEQATTQRGDIAPTPHARKPLNFAWADLLTCAQEMDAIDAEQAEQRPGNWHKRLHAVALQQVQADGRSDAATHLELKGLKHLIGLPGAGKTTLLMCLLRHLGLQSVKVAVFFPSIAVCRQYLEDLQRYGVNTGLLMGRSPATRQSHFQNLSEALAVARQRGEWDPRPSTPLFEGTCAIEGYTSIPLESLQLWASHCERIYSESTSNTPQLCPAWSLCGLNRAARGLPQASVWLGHVLSTDTRVPRHITPFDQRYFELIADTFDVVIFDEADRAQQDLDNRGLAELTLTGDPQSFQSRLQAMTLQPMADGRSPPLNSDLQADLNLKAAEFAQLSILLTAAIEGLSEPLQLRFEGQLLTPVRIISQWFRPDVAAEAASEDEPPEESEASIAKANAAAQAQVALAHLWERTALQVFQQRTLRANQSPPPDSETHPWAAALQRSPEEVVALCLALKAELADWLAQADVLQRNQCAGRITELLSAALGTADDVSAKQVTRLLLAVTFTAFSFRQLTNVLDVLSAQGDVEPMRMERLASEPLMAATPDNLLGSLSGVRFLGRPPQSIQLQYLRMAGAPRLLMHRLHEWRRSETGTPSGPAVLLTSATSYFPASPAHHVAATPDYVLQRTRPEREASAESRMVFRPITSGLRQPQPYLRYSGATSSPQGRDRGMEALRRMALALLDSSPQNSAVGRDVAAFDVQHGIARRAAFVVNSYEQVIALKSFIDNQLPDWRHHVVGVVKERPADSTGYVTTATAEALGDDDQWKLLIFPAGALGRGSNIVFTKGPRQRDAVLGSLYFLTRPHPAPQDLSFLVGLAARATQRYDQAQAPDPALGLKGIDDALRAARRKAYREVGPLLASPVMAQNLGNLWEPFVANQAVNLMQTIGRGMRNGCPVQCFFVDAAWASRTARGECDDERSSMLLQWRALLEAGIQNSDPREAALHRALYGEFLAPLQQLQGVNTAATSAHQPRTAPWGLDFEWSDDPF